jgi:hypothetical protein
VSQLEVRLVVDQISAPLCFISKHPILPILTEFSTDLRRDYLGQMEELLMMSRLNHIFSISQLVTAWFLLACLPLSNENLYSCDGE